MFSCSSRSLVLSYQKIQRETKSQQLHRLQYFNEHCPTKESNFQLINQQILINRFKCIPESTPELPSAAEQRQMQNSVLLNCYRQNRHTVYEIQKNVFFSLNLNKMETDTGSFLINNCFQGKTKQNKTKQ